MSSTYQLFPYQKQIVDEIPRRLAIATADNRGVLVFSPAGSGKSKMIAATCDRIANANKVALVLTHRSKIQVQLVDHCSAHSITADTDHIFIAAGSTYVAMNQTLIKRPFILKQLLALGGRLVLICDEAHRGEFNKTFDLLPQALRLGFTATPAYRWAKHLPKYYASLIHGPQISQLVGLGYLCPIDYFEMRSDLEDLRLVSTGEFTEASQNIVFDRAKLYDGLFEELPKFLQSTTKAIIFCASKKAADALNSQLLQHGYSSLVYYSGKILDGAGRQVTNSWQLAQFTQFNRCQILVTVAALSEGFDYPPIDLGILWRATGSLSLLIQMVMRVVRTSLGKSKATVLDFGGNNSRFGGNSTWNAVLTDRDWNSMWQAPLKPPRDANGVVAIKNCPACDLIINALARSCCNCGFIFPIADVLLREGELIQIQHEHDERTATISAMAGRRISTLSAPELALWAKERSKKAFAMRVAKSRTITNPQFAVEYGRAAGYSTKWANHVLREICEVQMYEPEYKILFTDILIK